MRPANPVLTITPTKADLDRFRRSASSPLLHLAKATAWRCLCIIEQKEKLGYPMLDIMANEMASEYRKKWAKMFRRSPPYSARSASAGPSSNDPTSC